MHPLITEPWPSDKVGCYNHSAQVSGVFIKQLQSVNISYRETLFLTARSMDSLNDGLFVREI